MQIKVGAGVIWSFVLVAGAAGYYWVWQPVASSEIVQGVSCKTRGGILLHLGADDPVYKEMMAKTPANQTRMEYGQGKGCLPKSGCVADPFEAEAAITRSIYLWKAKAAGYRFKKLFTDKLTNGKGVEFKPMPPSAAQLAQAEADEAQFCVDYLTLIRSNLPVPTQK